MEFFLSLTGAGHAYVTPAQPTSGIRCARMTVHGLVTHGLVVFFPVHCPCASKWGPVILSPW